MTFPATKRRILIGWLRDVADRGAPMLGARAIATRLILDPVDLADALVAELIADGWLAIDEIDGVRRPRVLIAPGAAMPRPIGADDLPRSPRRSSPKPVAETLRVPAQLPKPFPPKALAAVPEEASPPERVTPPLFTRGAKPFIRADVIRAARERGQPLDQFVTALIDIGFATWRARPRAQS